MDILLSAKVILRAMVTERSGSSEGMCMCVWKSLDNHPWTSIFWMSCQLEVLKIVCTGKACQYKMWHFMNRVRYNWRTSLALKEEIPIMSLSPAFHQIFRLLWQIPPTHRINLGLSHLDLDFHHIWITVTFRPTEARMYYVISSVQPLSHCRNEGFIMNFDWLMSDGWWIHWTC